jgi:hypothetical protein
MKNRLNPLILGMLILSFSCNEKVSPELQDANSSTTVNDTEVPDEYYFEVTNESATLLNYKIHKTGAGNRNAKCRISKNIPLANSLYANGADPDSDITCFLEAEELSLYHGGFSFGLSASKNTCDYVAYSPFSYYNRMPGNSTTTITKVTCADASISAAQVQAAVPNDTTVGTALDCNNNYLDDGVTTNRAAFTVEADEDLCRFNYSTGDEEQCDIGVITINEYAISLNEDGDPVTEITPSTLECGGEHYNCIRGPIRDFTTEFSRFTEIFSTELNADFSTQFDYASPISQGFPNHEYANFRRNLASFDINYVNAFGTSSSYMSAFGGVKDFTPLILDRYTNNRKLDGSDLIDSATWENNSLVTMGGFNIQSAQPLAAEAYMGLAPRTNPFYTFYCLDNAFDIKARIRVMIRDWDRVFPDSSNIELISDINLSTGARQDVFNLEEIPDDQDPLNLYNDRADWDDFLPMTRTSGAFNASTTEWEPSVGFFSPAAFPNYVYEN